MPSKDPAQRFEDILTNIQRIEFHITQITGEKAFEKNATVYAPYLGILTLGL